VPWGFFTNVTPTGDSKGFDLRVEANVVRRLVELLIEAPAQHRPELLGCDRDDARSGHSVVRSYEGSVLEG